MVPSTVWAQGRPLWFAAIFSLFALLQPPATATGSVADLASPDPAVRAAAATALGEAKDPQLIPPLAEALKDSSPLVRVQVAWALGQTRDHAAWMPLHKALRDKDASVRVEAIRSVARRNDGSLFSMVQELVQRDKDSGVRCAAVEALAITNRPSAPTYLVYATWDPDASVRAKAVWGLGQVRTFYSAVVESLDDPVPDVVQAAVQVLTTTDFGDSQQPGMLRYLIQALTSKTPQVRETAQGILVTLAGQDCGPTPEAWLDWWRAAYADWAKAHDVPGLEHGFCK